MRVAWAPVNPWRGKMDWTLQGRIYPHYLAFSLPQVTQLARDILSELATWITEDWHVQNPEVKSPAPWYVHFSYYLIFDHINVGSDWLEER